MKCKGTLKEKNQRGRTTTRICNYDLDKNAIFCPQCGTATDALRTKLSAKQCIKSSWKLYSNQKGKFYGFSIFLILTGFLLTALSVFFALDSYWLTNGLLLFTVPLLLVPFAMPTDFIQNPLILKNYLRAMKYYPKLWLFTMINILYFMFMKIICTGFITNIATDPLLHIVRFIMVNYWVVIIFTSTFLIFHEEPNIVKAMKLAHDASKELRWQIYFLLLFVILINAIGTALAGLGLLISLPFSYILLEQYYKNMQKYDLFKKNK